MKNLVFTLLLVAASVSGVFAQDSTQNKTPEERATLQTEWMKENLQLNDEQLSVVEELNLEYAEKMEEVRSVQGNMQKLKKARSISDEKDAKLEEIFSEEQFSKYQDMKKELRGMAKERYNARND